MGSNRKLLDLHIARSLEELKGRCSLPKDVKPTQALKSATLLTDEAYKADEQGDEEKCYIFFMRAALLCGEVLSKCNNSKTPIAERNLLREKVGPIYKKSVTKLEELTEKLEKRYEEKFKKPIIQYKSNSNINNGKDAFVLSHKKKSIDLTIKDSPASGKLKNSLTCKELYNIILDSSSSLMILDVRPVEDFKKSSILWSNCVNVPEKVALPGKTASQIKLGLVNMGLVSDTKWAKRLTADHLVLVDWFSTAYSIKEHSPIDNLMKSLTMWDIGANYKAKPLILDGGYKKWLTSFPTYTNNPKPEIPAEFSISPTEIDLDIQYPSFDPPVVAPLPSISDGISSNDVEIVVEDENANRDSSKSMPAFDRTKKPKPGADPMDTRYLKENNPKPVVGGTADRDQSPDAFLMKKNRENLIIPDSLGKDKPVITEKKSIVIKPDAISNGIRSPIPANTNRREGENLNELDLNEDENKRLAEEIRRLRDERKKREIIENKEYNVKPEPDSGITNGTARVPLKQESDQQDRNSGSGLKRSYSSPNINDLLPNRPTFRNPHPSITSQPSFDRALKPQFVDLISARQRNFCEVWAEVGPGLTGLKNLGNTCYMNATIQCLSNTPVLSKRLADPSISAQINLKSKVTKGEIAAEVAAVLRQLWTGKCRSIACKDLKSAVGKYEKSFRGSEQQDAQEFLISLMNWLHEDLNKVRIKQVIKERNFDLMDEREAADISWKDFRSQNDSAMTELFFGLYRSTVTCVYCHKKSVTFDAFSDLSVPLPASKNRCTLEECLSLFLQDEKISGWNCPQCKEKRDAIKKIDLWKLPPILVIYLKRFYHEGFLRRKLQNSVDFPLEDLDLSYVIKGPHERGSSIYDLQCVCNHIGTMDGGHYTSYCRNIYQNRWYKFDDHEVYETNSSNVVSSSAYILFYSSPQLLTEGCFP